MQRRAFLAVGVASVAAMSLPGTSAPQDVSRIEFDDAWRSISFPRLVPTRYELAGGTLSIAGDASSSLIYRPVPDAARGAQAARWKWTVTESVPPTNLSRRGGDDRNISVYFVFMDAQAATRLSPDTSPQRLLSSRSARTLIYVWGGNHSPGTLIASPYLRGRGFTIVLRPAGTGEGLAQVDLLRDHTTAFGSPPESLVGLAVSADSDDTESQLRATLSNLTLS